MIKRVLSAGIAVMFLAPGLAYAQNVEHDLKVQKRQHTQTEAAIGTQKEQAQDVREDTAALKQQRTACKSMSGAAEDSCDRQVQADKTEKRADVAEFKQDKAVHQREAAELKADHMKTKADKKAMGE